MKNINLIKEQTGPGITTVDYNSPEAKTGEAIAVETKKQRELKSSFDKKYITVNIPQNSQGIKQIVLPINTKYVLWKSDDDRAQSFFGSWEQDPEKSKNIPSEEDLKYYIPDNTLRSFRLPEGEYFLTRLKKISNTPPRWSFLWYYTKSGEIYDQSKYITMEEVPDDYLQEEGGFWDTWGNFIMITASIAAAALIPPPLGLIISATIDMIPAVQEFAEGDNVAGIISVILALTPFAGSKLFKISKAEAEILAKKFAKIPPNKVNETYNKLSPELKKAFQSVFRNDPYIMMNEFKKIMWEQLEFRLGKKLVDPNKAMSKINEALKNLPYKDVEKWYKTTGLKRLGFDLSVTTAGIAYLIYNKKQETINKFSKGFKNPIKVHQMSKEDYMNSDEEDYNSNN